jgi:type VI secretion system protein VasD
MLPAFHRILSIFFIAILMVACAGNEPQRTHVEGQIIATSWLNPDVKGEYRPVNIKIYFLASEALFNKEGFSALYQSPQNLLKDDLVFLLERQVLPGQTLQLDEEMPTGVKFVGVVAAFRNLDATVWKDLKKVPPKCFFCSGPGFWDPVRINLTQTAVSLSLEAQEN